MSLMTDISAVLGSVWSGRQTGVPAYLSFEGTP